MECQPGTRSGAAPASVAAADISALLPKSVGQGSLVTEDQREVCPLARGVMLPEAQPLSAPLQDGLRLFPPPLPAALSGRLTTPLAARGQQGNGLTTFRRCTVVV